MRQSNHYREIDGESYVASAKNAPKNASKNAGPGRCDDHPHLPGKKTFSIGVCTLIVGLNAAIFPLKTVAAPTTQNADESIASTQSAEPGDVEHRIASAIADLSSDDAGRRQAAADVLVHLGLPARPAIRKLIKSDDPSLSGQAAQILLQMPWAIATDPPEVKKLLASYGDTDIAKRREYVAALADLANQTGIDALLRLFVEEPSDDVRWSIVTALRTRADGPRIAHFRDADAPADGSAPALAMAGYAWLEFDLDKSAALLQRCANLEFAQPSDDDEEFDFVVKTLSDIAISNKKYDQAADLRRKQYARGGPVDQAGVPVALTELFALHGNFGPLKGFDDDVKLAGSAYQTPKIEYAVAQMDARKGDSAKADALRTTAFNGSSSRSRRYEAGTYLFDHGWDDLARKEYEELLKMPPNMGNEDDLEANDANVHFRLAGLAVNRKDDYAAAEEKEAAMRSLGATKDLIRVDGRGHRISAAADEIWAEIYWRYYRAAEAKGDQQTAMDRLNQLISVKPTDPDIAMDIVPGLKKRGLSDDARSIFRAAYAPLKARLDADPKNPSLMNEIAWTEAKCDERLDEALDFATKTVAAEPDNAAVIDTLAEVNFHLGHAEEAAKLEARALTLQPGDPFMTTQLKRFKAGPTTQGIGN